MKRIKHLLAWALYRQLTVCFACGAPGARPCTGHEYGGIILASKRRRFAPWLLAQRVDCRWSW